MRLIVCVFTAINGLKKNVARQTMRRWNKIESLGAIQFEFNDGGLGKSVEGTEQRNGCQLKEALARSLRSHRPI
jgi:hypothetical protein